MRAIANSPKTGAMQLELMAGALEIERLRSALAAEREECAKVAEARAEICKDALYQGDKMEVHTLNEALHIAAAIRARKG